MRAGSVCGTMRRMEQTQTQAMPSSEDVRAAVKELAGVEVRRLAETSGVPLTTLWNIRTGQTAKPALDTVRQFWPLIPAIRAGRQPA